MLCPKCGATNVEGATQCTTCGNPLSAGGEHPLHAPQAPYHPSIGAAPGQLIPNYFVQSLLLVLCCCPPLAIPAMVYSSQVNSKLALGDIEGATLSSQNARKWCWIALWSGLGVGVLSIILYVVLVVLLGVTSVLSR